MKLLVKPSRPRHNQFRYSAVCNPFTYNCRETGGKILIVDILLQESSFFVAHIALSLGGNEGSFVLRLLVGLWSDEVQVD